MIPDSFQVPDDWPTRPGRITLVAFDPQTEKPRPIWISRALLDKVARYQPPRRLEELCFNAIPTLRRPLGVWQGIRDHGTTGQPNWGYAYAGLPDFKPDGYGGQLQTESETFVVYLNEHWDLFDWAWETTDPSNNMMPEHFTEGRFGVRLWPRSQTN